MLALISLAKFSFAAAETFSLSSSINSYYIISVCICIACPYYFTYFELSFLIQNCQLQTFETIQTKTINKMTLNRLVLIIASVLLTTNSVHCRNYQLSDASQPQSIVDILVADPNYSTLVTAVKAVGLVDTLSTGINLLFF